MLDGGTRINGALDTVPFLTGKSRIFDPGLECPFFVAGHFSEQHHNMFYVHDYVQTCMCMYRKILDTLCARSFNMYPYE